MCASAAPAILWQTIGSSSAAISSAAGRDTMSARALLGELGKRVGVGGRAEQFGKVRDLSGGGGRDLPAGWFDDGLLDGHQTRNRPGGKDFGVATSFGQQI